MNGHIYVKRRDAKAYQASPIRAGSLDMSAKFISAAFRLYTCALTRNANAAPMVLPGKRT